MITEVLEHMAQRGQSVTLNWGEDTNCWECSWITGGKRYTGISKNMNQAVLDAARPLRDVVDLNALADETRLR